MKPERKKIWTLVLIGMVFFSCSAYCQDSGKPGVPRVVILDFDGGGQIDADQSAAMADSLSAAMDKSKYYDVVSRKDFKKAVREHEQKTGKPCTDRACLNLVARSLGAHPVKPSVKKDGRGCSVSVGLMGADGKNMASGKLKRGACSPRNMKIAAEGAVMFMTNEIIHGAKIDEIDTKKERSALSASEQPPEDTQEQLDQEFDEATQPKTDKKAEQNAKNLEEEARRKLGLGK